MMLHSRCNPMMTMKGDSDINGNHEDEDAEEGYANESKKNTKHMIKTNINVTC